MAEVDPVEDELVRQAASDCLQELGRFGNGGGITMMIRSGNDILRVRVTRRTLAIQEAAVDAGNESE